MRGFEPHLLKVSFSNHHILFLLELVALDGFLAPDLAMNRAAKLLPDALVTVAVKEIELDGFCCVKGGVDADGNLHERDFQMSGPNRSHFHRQTLWRRADLNRHRCKCSFFEAGTCRRFPRSVTGN